MALDEQGGTFGIVTWKAWSKGSAATSGAG